MFQTERYQKIFSQHQLGGFDQLWARKIDWFEEPNQRRGGWSGVGKVDLGAKGSEFLSVFIKKQKNHGRRTLLHPIAGEPTFRREFKRLQYLERNNVHAPNVVFYDEKRIEDAACAVLITETLINFEPLDEVIASWHEAGSVTRKQKQHLLATVASFLKRFHQSGLVHRALYPKHIFVKNAPSQPEFALIDLEKARFSPLFWYRAYFDLSALNRHADYWTRSERLAFFLQYCGTSKLTLPLKFLCRLIMRRAARR